MTGRPGRLAGLSALVPDQPGPRDADAPAEPPAARADGVATVFRVHYAHLVRLARHLLDDPADAEDVVMDAFAGLSRHWGHVRRTDDVFFYLRASVVNGSRSRLRRLRTARERRHTQVERDSAPAEQLARVHLEHESVVVLLRALPRRQREVLVLRYYDGATEVEIAETLGISLGSVKTHASRGLQALKAGLEATA